MRSLWKSKFLYNKCERGLLELTSWPTIDTGRSVSNLTWGDTRGTLSRRDLALARRFVLGTGRECVIL